MFLSVDSVMSGLNNLRVCLTERDDLMPDVDKTLYSLCLDLMLYLSKYNPVTFLFVINFQLTFFFLHCSFVP